MKRMILLILTLIIILPIKTNALSVNKNTLTIEKGKSETINLTTTSEAEITEIKFTLTYTTYDVPASYNIATGLTDATPNLISHKILLSEPTSGVINLGTVKINVTDNASVTAGAININSATATTVDGEIINLKPQTINVTIGKTIEDNDNKKEENKPVEDKKEEPPKNDENKKTEDKQNEERQHLLEKIESNIVDIKLQNGIYEYTVKIKEDVSELDLKPIVKDSKYKVEISNQKIKELDDNQIKITVKNDKELQEYKIKVKILKVNEIEIDNSEFKSTYKYKGKWIVLITCLSITAFVGLLINKKSK